MAYDIDKTFLLPSKNLGGIQNLNCDESRIFEGCDEIFLKYPKIRAQEKS